MRLISAFLLGALVIALATPAVMAKPMNPPAPLPVASAPPDTSGVSYLRTPDPQQELRQLSKNLKLKKDQRVGVGTILEERTREIQLLQDIQSVSDDYRQQFAAKVMADSDAQIATLLRGKQKRKFNRRLARHPDKL